MLLDLGTLSEIALENVSTFELQSIQRIDCNLAIRQIDSKHLKMTKAIWIINFQF